MGLGRASRRQAQPSAGCAATTTLILFAALALLSLPGVRTLNVDRVNGLRADGIHYEYHVYRMASTGSRELESLVDPVARQAPAGDHLFSNLTIFSPEEEQVVREFVQPVWAWLPLVPGADGQPKWLTYDEASGAVVETNATYMSDNTAPLSGGRLVTGGCLDQNGQWFHPDNNKAAIVVKHRVRERGTFRHGDSYYNIERRRSTFIVTHASAGQREFLSYPGKVASIETAEENAFLASVLRETGIEAAWIGAVRASYKEVNNPFSWAWGTQVDGTRSARVFGASPHADECRLKGGVAFVPGVYHNFTDVFEPCGDALAGVVLRADGTWSTVVSPFDRFPRITEFASSRNLSGEVAYRDKVFRVEALDETEVAARATAEGARYDFLPGVTLSGHLPVPESLSEVMLLTQIALAARPSVCTSAALIRRATRAYLGFDFPTNAFEFTAAYGPNQGLGVGIAPNNSYAPHNILNIDGITERCIAAEGLAYRFGVCNLPKGVTIAEFNLNSVDGRFYIPLGFVASAFGLQQLVGSRRGALIAHVPIVLTEAQFLVFNSTAARGGFGDAFVSSVSRVANTPFRWPDGQLVGANLSIAPRLDPVSGKGARCLSVRPINDPQLPSALWVSGTCADEFSPLILEYSRQPVRPEELGVLPVSEGCTLTPPLFQCVGRGLTRVPQVSNPGSYNAILLSTNHLSRVDSSGFLLPNLLDARVFANEITSVDDDAFVGCPKLQSLDLSLNSLTEMPRLDYLTALTTLTLENNNIQLIRPGVLPLSLQSLVLSLNAITEIPAGAFAGLSNLTLLSLNSNPIGAVHISGFAPVNQASVFMSNTPCACSVSAGVLVQCAPDCQVFGNTTTTFGNTTTTPLPAFQTAAAEPRSSSGAGAGIIAAAVVLAVIILLALAMALVRSRRRKAAVVSVQAMIENPLQARHPFYTRFAELGPDPRLFEDTFLTTIMPGGTFRNLASTFAPEYRVAEKPGRHGSAAKPVLLRMAGDMDELGVEARLGCWLRDRPHPNILTYVGCVVATPRLIAFTHMPDGDLRSFVHACRPTAASARRVLAPEDFPVMAVQLLSACSFLERNKIVHGALTARNFLVSNSEQVLVRLTNFASSRGEDYDGAFSLAPGAEPWASPELLRGALPSTASDVFALGVVLYEMTSFGKQPWGLASGAEVRREVLDGHRLSRPPSCPETLYQFMQYAWEESVRRRPSFADMYSAMLTKRLPRPQNAAARRGPDNQQLVVVRELAGAKGHTQLVRWKANRDVLMVARSSASGNAAVVDLQVGLLETLAHTNVVAFLGRSPTDPFTYFLEWCALGSLHALVSSGSAPDADGLLGLGADVASGLEYLAARQIVHRRLSSRHVYVGEGMVAKIGGFGDSRQEMAEGADYLSLARMDGIDRSLAPEVYRFRSFAKASDVYSLGVVLHEIGNTGRGPFDALTDAEFLSSMSTRQLPSQPVGLRGVDDLAAQCLAFQASQRPTAARAARVLADLAHGASRWEYTGNLIYVRELGSGNFGVVEQMVAEDLPAKGERAIVAVKTLHVDSDDAVKEFMNEMKLMKKIHHPNLACLLAVCTQERPYKMVLEFHSGGALDDWLEVHSTTLQDKLLIMHQICCGMASLHELAIIHRDLAARNCLVGDHLVVKVADLGLSREASFGGDGDDEEGNEYYRATTSRQLPLRWMAPEIFSTSKFTLATDVWSFGCLIYELFFPAQLPFENLENSEVIATLSSPNAPLTDLFVGVESIERLVQKPALNRSVPHRPRFEELAVVTSPENWASFLMTGQPRPTRATAQLQTGASDA